MIRLRLDTTYLDLEPAGLDLSIHNPLFDRDGAEALYSFPFRLPATAKNLHALSHANRLDNSSNETLFTGATLEIEGLPFESDGMLELDGQTFAPDGIGAVFKSRNSQVLEELAKIKIAQILETVSTQSSPPVPRWTFAVVSTPPVTVVFTIAGETFSQLFTFGSFSSNYTSLANSINAEFPGLATAAASNLYLDSVLLETYPLEAFTNIDLISSVTPGEAIYTGFLNHVTATNLTPAATHCWPMVSWPGFYKEASRDQFWDFVNPWVDSVHIENQPRTDKLWAATYVPFVYSTYVLERIAEQLPGLLQTWAGWPVDDADGSALIIFNNRALDFLEENYYEVGVRKWLNRFVEEVDLNRHVPDITAEQYMRVLLDGFALWWKYEDLGITFYKKRDMLAAAPLNWTAKSEPLYTATRNRRRGFSLEYPDLKREDQLLPHPTQLLPFESGEAWNEFVLPFHSASMRSGAVANYGVLAKFPEVYQAGSSNEAGLGENAYSMRFLFFRGLAPASNTAEYVLASHDATDYNDDPTGSLSLDLEAADGLYHLHHKGLPELLADGQPITITMRLSISDILTLRTWTNARRTIKLPEGQVTAVVKSVKFRVDANGLGLSLVEFVQEK